MHIDWIDRWKGLLIILVVAGHVFGGACHMCSGSSSAVFALLYKIIYMFHMPAFFFLAGMCWKSKDDSFVIFAINKARRLLIPYIAFGLASVALYLLMTQGNHLFTSASDDYYQGMGAKGLYQPFLSLLIGNGWPDGEGFRCNSVLWFLPAMFSVLCFYWLIDHFLKGRLSQLALGVVLLTLEFLRRKYGFFNLPFGLTHIPWYGSFVILGRWSQFIKQSNSIHCTPTPTTYTFLIFLLLWLVFSVLSYFGPNGYFAYVKPHWYLASFIMAILGIFLSAVTAKNLTWLWLSKCGKASLGIMLIHKFIILGLQLKVPLFQKCMEIGGVCSLMAVLCVIVFTTAISYGISQVPGIRKIVGCR